MVRDGPERVLTGREQSWKRMNAVKAKLAGRPHGLVVVGDVTVGFHDALTLADIERQRADKAEAALKVLVPLVEEFVDSPDNHGGFCQAVALLDQRHPGWRGGGANHE